MDTRMDETLKPRGTELQLKGLIYVRALRAAGGASTEELQQFSAEIRRQRRQLEGERGQIGHGFVKAARPPPSRCSSHGRLSAWLSTKLAGGLSAAPTVASPPPTRDWRNDERNAVDS
jgi:hypothetical protein